MSKLEWLISKLSRRARWRLSSALDHISGMCVDGDVQQIADLCESGKIQDAAQSLIDLVHETGIRDHQQMTRMRMWITECTIDLRTTP